MINKIDKKFRAGLTLIELIIGVVASIIVLFLSIKINPVDKDSRSLVILKSLIFILSISGTLHFFEFFESFLVPYNN